MAGELVKQASPVGDMLVVGGLCRCDLHRHGASCGAGKVHRLLRVPPTGCVAPWRFGGPGWRANRLSRRRRSETCSSSADFAVAASIAMVRLAVQAKYTDSCACLRPAALHRCIAGKAGGRVGRPCKPLAFAFADQASAGQDGGRSATARCPGLGERRRFARPSHGAPFWLVRSSRIASRRHRKRKAKRVPKPGVVAVAGCGE